MIRTRVLAALVGLMLSVGALSSAAQPTEAPMKAAAKNLYNEARDARKTDDFATCYAKSTAAWAVHKHPSIAALVGDCAIGHGKFRDGAEKLKFFFDSAQKAGSEELRVHLARRLEEAKKHIAVVELSVTVLDAACEVDGKRIEKLPATLFLEPGSHAFEARHPEYQTRTRQATLAAGVTLAMELQLDPNPGTAPTAQPDTKPAVPPEEPGVGYLVAAGVSGGVAVGGLVLMIASLALHGSASDDVDAFGAEVDALAGGSSACNIAANAATCGNLNDAIDDQSTFATLFPVGIVIAGVGAAASATFLILHFTGSDSTEASLGVSPNGISVRGRF